MKILKKNETTIEVARHRKEQIDEGLALAQKIDRLRETLSSLELQQAQYIVVMKDKLEKEIEPLIKERDELKVEVSELKQKKETLRKSITNITNELGGI